MPLQISNNYTKEAILFKNQKLETEKNCIDCLSKYNNSKNARFANAASSKDKQIVLQAIRGIDLNQNDVSILLHSLKNNCELEIKIDNYGRSTSYYDNKKKLETILATIKKLKDDHRSLFHCGSTASYKIVIEYLEKLNKFYTNPDKIISESLSLAQTGRGIMLCGAFTYNIEFTDLEIVKFIIHTFYKEKNHNNNEELLFNKLKNILGKKDINHKIQEYFMQAVADGVFGNGENTLISLATIIKNMQFMNYNTKQYFIDAINNGKFGNNEKVLIELIKTIKNINDLWTQSKIIDAINNGKFGNNEKVLIELIESASLISNPNVQNYFLTEFSTNKFDNNENVCLALVNFVEKMEVSSINQKDFFQAINNGKFGNNETVCIKLVNIIEKMEVSSVNQKDFFQAITDGKFGNNETVCIKLVNIIEKMDIQISSQFDFIKAIVNNRFGNNETVYIKLVNIIENNITDQSTQKYFLKEISDSASKKIGFAKIIEDMKITSIITYDNFIKAIINGTLTSHNSLLTFIKIIECKIFRSYDYNIFKEIASGKFCENEKLLLILVNCIEKIEIPLKEYGIFFQAITDGKFGNNETVCIKLVNIIEKMNMQDKFIESIIDGKFGDDKTVNLRLINIIRKMNIPSKTKDNLIKDLQNISRETEWRRIIKKEILPFQNINDSEKEPILIKFHNITLYIEQDPISFSFLTIDDIKSNNIIIVKYNNIFKVYPADSHLIWFKKDSIPKLPISKELAIYGKNYWTHDNLKDFFDLYIKP